MNMKTAIFEEVLKERTKRRTSVLATTVTNATYSTYVYTNDLLGCRTSKNDEQYGYNARDELIAADEVSYAYDDIGLHAPTSVSEVGNRTTAEGKTAIDDFAPQYDADGNQTLIKTETGIWSVTYNAENRPIRWESGDTVITMAFDRMGRRIEMRTVKDDEETLQRFVYDNYLCVQQLRGADNAIFHSYVWDPTEPIATRPLIFIPSIGEVAYYFHDGNKNVSDLVCLSGAFVHYDYTPFGSITASAPSENPFGFSSEFYDSSLGLVYYNYRHYNPLISRWLRRDLVFQLNPYEYQGTLSHPDFLGLTPCCTICVYSAIDIATLDNLNGPLSLYEGFSGHTWFTIEDRKNEDNVSNAGSSSNDGVIFSFGPYLDPEQREGLSYKELVMGVNGDYWDVKRYEDPEKGYTFNKRCWTADRETCCALKQEVNDFLETPDTFSAFNYCTSKTIEILQRHNIPVPDGEGEVEIPYFFNISAPNPRDLYIQLGNLPETLPHVDNTHNPKEGKGNIK